MSRRTVAVASLVGATVFVVSWLSQPLAAPPPPTQPLASPPSVTGGPDREPPPDARGSSTGPAPEAPLSPPALAGVFVHLQGSGGGTAEVSSIVDQRLRAWKAARVSISEQARHELNVTVESATQEEQMYETTVITNSATVNIRGVDRLSNLVLFDYTSAIRRNTVQDSSVGQRLAAREAVLGLLATHPDIARLLAGGPGEAR